jgi:hypothetical protein
VLAEVDAVCQAMLDEYSQQRRFDVVAHQTPLSLE